MYIISSSNWDTFLRRLRTSTRKRSCSRCSGLIDVVMIANLLIMVIVGGYETFVSRLRLEEPSGPT